MVVNHGKQYQLCMELFSNKKFNLKNVLMDLIKNLKSKYNIQVQYMCCDNAGEKVDFKWDWKKEGMGTDSGTPHKND